MQQTALFDDLDPKPYTWRPEPRKVRNRLRWILAEMAEAQTNPWSGSVTRLRRRVVLELSGHLPDEEAADWRGRFSAEFARLDPEGGPLAG